MHETTTLCYFVEAVHIISDILSDIQKLEIKDLRRQLQSSSYLSPHPILRARTHQKTLQPVPIQASMDERLSFLSLEHLDTGVPHPPFFLFP